MTGVIMLYGIAFIALAVSFAADRAKTRKAITVAWKSFMKIIRPMLILVVLSAASLTLLSDDVIMAALGGSNRATGIIVASIVGSIAFIPGFIVFPLCGILLEKGVSYMVLSAFTTTLMMVGVMSFPMERTYFGARFAVTRNVMSFFIAITVAFVTGVVFGEVFP